MKIIYYFFILKTIEASSQAEFVVQNSDVRLSDPPTICYAILTRPVCRIDNDTNVANYIEQQQIIFLRLVSKFCVLCVATKIY